MRFLIILFFCFLLSCNNYIPVNSNNIVISNTDLKNTTVLYKTNKPYVISKKIVIPENHSFILKNGVSLFLKKNGEILNNGSFILGERNRNDSVFEYYLNNNSLFFNSKIYSNNSGIIYSGETGGLFIANNILFEGVSIINKKSKMVVFNSLFLKSEINSNYSDLKFQDSFFNLSSVVNNSSKLHIVGCLFNNLKGYLVNNNIKNSIINNCLIKNSKYGFKYILGYNNNIINSIFYNNDISVLIEKKNKGYLKFFNNIFYKNKLVFHNNDSSQLYIINNIFDLNNEILKSFLDKKTKKIIISKNNIFSNNKNLFDLNNIKISNTYCISNTDSISGYYNIYSDPFYINSNNFNYNLNNNSPGFRSGINNKNLGVNISDINIIKYLKY